MGSIARALRSDANAVERSWMTGKPPVPVYPIADGTAELVGKIGAESSAAGTTIPFDDLLIGTSALERGYAVATRNLRHFQKIPRIRLISL
jgi:predicted nucleic acid-binding protein